ncbi:Asp23/Gls24 family envelope stress response protein [Paenarthrobacter aurescens]|nr:Asp23/Gls24 family envelope stress response protein [Paenarthrobacter aurescens]MDO6145398.1 Asp23/Gls24 family envelope stress response protein [Paenarthrobacter aurescens]MDO6149203.1 Asp23/Gls24 family envelope stress response protein [Paenarthrobacter aurescens]MDO6160447.1 Asp23/Gls24 family envelope stress response protein [Paenarthrobacter aurescens]MDO6164306.1 Asp23/Gls24 family envelope stress response protein [Paenarthrobacter aurescens]
MAMNTPGDALECGHSLAELSTYVDTGQIADPVHLQSCPECQAGLASLRSLSQFGSELLSSDLADAGSGHDDWMQSILDNLRLELRPGRSIPLTAGDPRDSLWETEGSISALIRSVVDAFPGTAAGKCRLHGDITTAGAGICVEVEIAVVYGHPMEERAAELRRQLSETLAFQTELTIESINITVTDVLEPPPPTSAGPGKAGTTPAAFTTPAPIDREDQP